MNLREANDILQHKHDHWSHEVDDAREYAEEVLRVLCEHGDNSAVIGAIDYFIADDRNVPSERRSLDRRFKPETLAFNWAIPSGDTKAEDIPRKARIAITRINDILRNGRSTQKVPTEEEINAILKECGFDPADWEARFSYGDWKYHLMVVNTAKGADDK